MQVLTITKRLIVCMETSDISAIMFLVKRNTLYEQSRAVGKQNQLDKLKNLILMHEFFVVWRRRSGLTSKEHTVPLITIGPVSWENRHSRIYLKLCSTGH